MSYLHKIETKTIDFTNKYATLILLFLLILISISFFTAGTLILQSL